MKILVVPNILENFFKNKLESTMYQQNNMTSSKQSVVKKMGYWPSKRAWANIYFFMKIYCLITPTKESGVPFLCTFFLHQYMLASLVKMWWRQLCRHKQQTHETTSLSYFSLTTVYPGWRLSKSISSRENSSLHVGLYGPISSEFSSFKMISSKYWYYFF